MAQTPNPISRLFRNAPSRLLPLAGAFFRRQRFPNIPQEQPFRQPRTILDIYRIDETKKWVDAVRNTQRKKLLRQRFYNIFSFRRLFGNWGVRNYSSRYAGVAVVPPIEVFHMNLMFAKDEDKKKVNLGVGAYRDDKGKPWVLPVVKKAEKIILEDVTLNKEYLPITGLAQFTEAATKLALGDDNEVIRGGKILAVQSLSGTGALKVASEFLCKVMGYNTYYVSKPTWENHNGVFRNSGFTVKKEYRYWDHDHRGINFDGLIADLCEAPENSVIIFHCCAHNPTGSDPTHDQWKEICEIVKEKKLFPLFDTAYLGFASGDVNQDAWALRYFIEQGLETIVCQSFAKNFGLYNERTGNCIFVLNDPKAIEALKSQISIIIRTIYSNPPAHGARIVATILNDRDLKEEWYECVLRMACRVRTMRTSLRKALEKLKTPGKWDHITDQIGMFSFTGLNAAQSKNMIEKHHVYMVKSGRISMCGITAGNVDYVARAIHESVTNVK